MKQILVLDSFFWKLENLSKSRNGKTYPKEVLELWKCEWAAIAKRVVSTVTQSCSSKSLILGQHWKTGYTLFLTTTPCLYSTKSKSPDSTLYFLRSVFQSSCGCKEIWIKTRKWTLDNTWNNCTKVSTSMQDGHMKRPSTLYIKVNEVSDGSARNMAHNILFDRLRTIANRSLNVKLNH